MRIEKVDENMYKRSVPTSVFAFLLGIIVGVVVSMIIVSVVL